MTSCVDKRPPFPVSPPGEANAAALAMSEIVTPGGRTVSYIEAGAGIPVVLLHGIGSGARSWTAQLDDLSGRFRIIAWDAPGYGTSTAVASPQPRAGEYADALTDFVDALALERFHLVGHSLGALIAARYAAEHPDRLLSLTLASIAGGHAMHPPQERARLREGRLTILTELGPRGMAESRGANLLTPAATDTMRRAVIETMATVRPDGYRQAVFLLSGGDTRADVLRIPPTVPTQIIVGGGDTVTTPEQNRVVASAKPQAPVHVIDGAGHAVYIEKAAEFNKRLRDFLTDNHA
jgi:pimeloyl-ACP methyl ester carboxylesterase